MRNVPAKHIQAYLKQEVATLYGGTSQLVRLEWETETGGALNAAHGKNTGATKVTHILDNVQAMWGPVQENQRERIKLEGLALNIDQNGFWYFDNARNLAAKPKMVILHRLKDKFYSGLGTGALAVWTPDVAPGWTVDEWAGYDLVFSDRRFKVLSNTTTALTVTLDGGTLPAGSTTGEVLKLVEWYPVRESLDVLGGSFAPMGLESIFQSVYCQRMSTVGA